MAKCPACGVNLGGWRILTLGKSNSIQCSKCGKTLKGKDKVSGVKVLVGFGFLAGGLAGGVGIASGYFIYWITFILLWFLILALADVRYTQLDVSAEPQSKGQSPKPAPGPARSKV